MKERATVILSLRLDKRLLQKIDVRVPLTNHRSRNSWLLWTIEQGLRNHRK